MPRAGREQQERERRANAERWAAWLTPALARAGWRPADLAAASDGEISRQVASKWTNADHAPVPKLAILTARLLKRDAIEALRAAGHEEIARFAEELRADPPAALIKREMEAIGDDPWLDWLEAERIAGVVSEAEYIEARRNFLRRKEESIRLIRADYEEALRRKRAEGPKPNGNRAAQ
jgi:hypothetical protein